MSAKGGVAPVDSTPPSGMSEPPPPSASDALTENISYMKLLHELKAEFPAVPDDFVKQCISEHGNDRNLCVNLLSEESERLKRNSGPLKGRFNLQALLSHQMQQRLHLELELRNKREELDRLRGGVLELKERLDQKEMLKMGPFGAGRDVSKKATSLQKDISELQHSCNKMADEVTKLTHGTVPLCETSIEFYESLSSNSFPPPSPNASGTPQPPPAHHHQQQHLASASAAAAPVLPPAHPMREMSPANASVVPSTADLSNAVILPPALGNDNNLSRSNSGSGAGRSRNPSALNPEGPQWNCSVCTFANHPALDRCEFCEMPRIAGASPGDVGLVTSSSSQTNGGGPQIKSSLPL